MIAENVVFVSDENASLFYIPVDKLRHWNDFVDDQYFHGVIDLGLYPEYATPVEGETYVVNIIEEL